MACCPPPCCPPSCCPTLDPRFYSRDPYSCLRPTWCPRRRLPAVDGNWLLGAERRLAEQDRCVKGVQCLSRSCTPRAVDAKGNFVEGVGQLPCGDPKKRLKGGACDLFCTYCGRKRSKMGLRQFQCASCNKVKSNYLEDYMKLLSWKYGWLYELLRKNGAAVNLPPALNNYLNMEQLLQPDVLLGNGMLPNLRPSCFDLSNPLSNLNLLDARLNSLGQEPRLSQARSQIFNRMSNANLRKVRSTSTQSSYAKHPDRGLQVL